MQTDIKYLEKGNRGNGNSKGNSNGYSTKKTFGMEDKKGRLFLAEDLARLN